MERCRRSLIVLTAALSLLAGRLVHAADSPLTPAPKAAPPAAQVHVTADAGRVTLYRIDPDRWIFSGVPSRHSSGAGTVEHWMRVCDTPCDATVAPADALVVAGLGVTPSSPFNLGEGNHNLRVKPGSASARTLGGTGIILGAGFMLGGGVMALVPSPNASSPQGQPPLGGPGNTGASQPTDNSSDAFHTFRTIGLVTLVVGAAMVIAGSIAFVGNQTEVSF